MRNSKPTTPVMYRFTRATSHSDRSARPTLNRAAFSAFLAAADNAVACSAVEDELNNRTTWTTGLDF